MSPLDHFPEELLERILSDVIAASSNDEPRPTWLRSPSYRPDFRLAPLLVSKQFSRIAFPLFYHSINIHTPTTARLLRRTLVENPIHASQIRQLSVTGICDDAAGVLQLCGPSVKMLDVTLALEEESGESGTESPRETEKEFAEALKGLTGVQHLTLRKPNNVYLSLRRPRYIIAAVAHAIPAWPGLESANIAFKLSDDTPTSPQHTYIPVFPSLPFSLPASNSPPSSPIAASVLPQFSSPVKQSAQQLGPISALTHALALAPCLHTFATHLPSVWNLAILTVSSNPRLERIMLSSAGSRGSITGMNAILGLASPVPQHGQGQLQGGIVGTGLFLMEARRHTRLTDLIKAGTYIIRSRARTLGTPGRSPGRDGLPSPPGSPGPFALGFALGLGISGVEQDKERV